MSTQDLNYEQPTVSDAAVDNSDDYTEYTFSTTKRYAFRFTCYLHSIYHSCKRMIVWKSRHSQKSKQNVYCQI